MLFQEVARVRCPASTKNKRSAAGGKYLDKSQERVRRPEPRGEGNRSAMDAGLVEVSMI